MIKGDLCPIFFNYFDYTHDGLSNFKNLVVFISFQTAHQRVNVFVYLFSQLVGGKVNRCELFTEIFLLTT